MPFSTVFFDLDETMYSKNTGVWRGISDRIDQFLVERLGLTRSAARNARARYYRLYGTTLTGLLRDFNVNAEEYLAYVHDLPLETMLRPDPELSSMLKSLPQRRVVFTNADRAHATRVLEELGVERHIDAIIDIHSTDFINKPHPEAYQRALLLEGNPAPRDCVLVDDREENLTPANSLGMTTVLVNDTGPRNSNGIVIPRLADLTKAMPELLSVARESLDGN